MSLQQEVGWTRDTLRFARYLAQAQDAPFIVCSLDNIGDELENWNNMFPTIEPTFHVGSNPLVEVLQYLQQLGLELHVKNKRDLAALMKVDQGSCNTVYSCSTKLSSQIRTAAAAGVQLFYVDSVSEMEKIKKLHPMARIIVEISMENTNNNESLEASSGVAVDDVQNIITEAKRLGLEIEGFAVNLDVAGSLDQDDNLAGVKKALKVAEAAVKIAKEGQLEVKTLHLGQLCNTSINIPQSYVNEINNILSADVFRNIRVKSDASHFLTASSITLATKIVQTRIDESVTYVINESIFGAFSANLTTSECCVPAPLPLGGGGIRKGISNKFVESAVVGNSGDDVDVVLPLGEVVLPRMEEGDWILFPNMGTMNLQDFVGSCRKSVGNQSFVSVKSKSEAASNICNLNEVLQKEAAMCIDLDSYQDENSNGLKGEIDLRKTFIYGN